MHFSLSISVGRLARFHDPGSYNSWVFGPWWVQPYRAGFLVKGQSSCLDLDFQIVPWEQRFLSCMAFSVYEVVRVACLSRSWFVT